MLWIGIPYDLKLQYIGENIQFSTRYNIPFKPLYGNFRSVFVSGFDWKYLTSNLFYLGNPAELLGPASSSQTITVSQFLFGYTLFNKWANDVLNFDAELTASVWKNGFPFQTTSSYEESRPGSHVRYAYLSLTATHQHQFPFDLLLSTRFRAQLASNTLPTSEQFGLGGADTVRGYFEQQFVADNALCLNMEFYTPPLSLFRSNKNELTFLLFADYGYGRNYSYISPPYQQQHLLGIGPGIHYDIMPYSSLKIEYGFQLLGIPQDHRFGRFHLSLSASY